MSSDKNPQSVQHNAPNTQYSNALNAIENHNVDFQMQHLSADSKNARQNVGKSEAQNAGQDSLDSVMQGTNNANPRNAGQNLTPQEYAKMEEFVKMSSDFARGDDANSLKIMLDNGLNPNLANHKGDTLLMLASYHNALACVKLLLDFGANVDTPNDKGHTPLAGVCFKGYKEVAKLLLESGANPNGYDKNSATNGRNDSKNATQASANDSKGNVRSSVILSPINTAIMFRRKEILSLLLRYNNKKLGFWQRLFSKF